MTENHSVRCFLALGGNLGPVLDIFGSVLTDVLPSRGIAVESISSLYRTRAITLEGHDVQPDYWNAVTQVSCRHSAQELLDELLAIEERFGRIRTSRWGPRTLDLDLLGYGECVIETATLQVPHPRLAERAFVLAPLLELAPGWVVPGMGLTVRVLWNRLGNTSDDILEKRAASAL
ncbi:MAG: 2-amino-4-hydroxy-6-hydroxymethyldihydropteridine diphosphokinase [Myxococcota bacterium]